jgi:hypothetical protein
LPTCPSLCLSSIRFLPINRGLIYPQPPQIHLLTMKRPLGVILSLSVLGIGAALQLCLAALAGFAGVVLSGDLNSPQSVTPALCFSLSIALTLFAGWTIATLFGLLRLRIWARYSILGIAGCTLGFSALSFALLTFNLGHVPLAAAQVKASAYTMHNVLLFEALVWISAAAIPGWWLVYFNLRSTKAYFLPGYQSGPAD